MNVDRKMALDEGVAALHRLAKVALNDSGQCRFIARFLLGLYNGTRFPFDLTDLRAVDGNLFEDCMLVLRMDARFTEKEVHCYFTEGGALFEEMAARWMVLDHNELRIAVKTGVREVIKYVHEGLGERATGKVLVCGHTPGYRNVSATLELRSDPGAEPVTVKADFDNASCLALFETFRDAQAKPCGLGDPIDKRPGEVRPGWMKSLA